MKTYLINLKLQIRNFFISNSKSLINIKVVLGCFPIVFGISKTLYFKHQNDIFSNVLKNSLPGISPLSFQISWPTLEQIFLDQLYRSYLLYFLLSVFLIFLIYCLFLVIYFYLIPIIYNNPNHLDLKY